MADHNADKGYHWREMRIPVLWMYPGLFTLFSMFDLATDIFVMWGFFEAESSLLFALSASSILFFYMVAAFRYSYHLVSGGGKLADRWPMLPVVLVMTIVVAPPFILIDIIWLLKAFCNFLVLFFTCCYERKLLAQTDGYAKPHMMFKRRMNEFVFESVPQLSVQVCAVVLGEGVTKRSLLWSIAASISSLLLNGYSIYKFKAYSKLSFLEVLAIAADTPRNIGIGHLMIDTYSKRFIVKDIHLDFSETEFVVAEYYMIHWPSNSADSGIDKLELNLKREKESFGASPDASEYLIKYLRFLLQDKELSVSKLAVDLMLYGNLPLELFEIILEFIRVKCVSETVVKVYESKPDMPTKQLNSVTRDEAINQLVSDQFSNDIRKIQITMGPGEPLGFAREGDPCECV